MSKTVQSILKIVSAGLALAALVCLVVGSWEDLVKGCKCLKQRICSLCGEYDDYADEELYD